MRSLSFTQKVIAVGLGTVAIAGWAYAFALYGDVAERDADLARAGKLMEKQELALAQAKTEAAIGGAGQPESADSKRFEAEIAEIQSRAEALVLKVSDLEESNKRLREESVALASQAQKLRRSVKTHSKHSGPSPASTFGADLRPMPTS